MTIAQTIDFVCKELKLDVDTLICQDGCKQRKRYFEARMIITYILRTQETPVYYERIAYHLGRGVVDGKGNHVIAWRYFKIVNELIEVNDRRFTDKLNAVLKKINLNHESKASKKIMG